MEESEKRRERLKAMRIEAAQGGVNNDVENSTQTRGLSNPLVETSATNQDSCPQRFGYYTDPLAAFSGNKRSKVGRIISQEHPTPPIQQKTVMTSPPSLPSHIMHQQQESVHSPMGMVPPSGMQPGTTRGAWNGSGHTYGYNIPPYPPIGGNFPSTASSGFGQGSSPVTNSPQGQGQWLGNSPGPNSGQGGIPGFGHQGGPGFNPEEGRGYWSTNIQSPGAVRGGSPGFGQGGRGNYGYGQGRGPWSSNIPSPGPGRGSSPGFGQGGRPNFSSAQGRGSWPTQSHIPGSGRGSGQWSNNNGSPGSARSGGRGGRGRGYHDNISAELRPDLYYNKSMAEDPWKFLKPIIWIREESPTKNCNSSKSWLPKSISTPQRAKAAAASSESKSQPSLAEYLAASFNDAIKNENTHEA